MFEIEYKGGNSVLITTKNSKLWIDPNIELLGLRNKKLDNVVQLATEKRFLVDADNSVQLEGPGDYEAGDFAIHGAPALRHIDTSDDGNNTTIYRVLVDDIRIGVVGNVAPKLSESQLEHLGIIDILILPVGGGGYTLDATSAASMVRQAEPKVVIPVHYNDSAITYEVPQDTVETFTQELGADVEKMPKLKLKSSSSLPQTMTVYQLDRQ